MVVILPYCIKAKKCEHNALGYWSGLVLCLTKVRSSRARCPATALIGICSRSQVSVYRTIGPLVRFPMAPVAERLKVLISLQHLIII